MWERIIRGLGVVTVITFIVVTLTPATNAVGHRLAVTSDRLQPADAIVVLGAGLLRGGALDEESMRRVIAGIELFKKGMAPIIVLSGTARPDSPGLSEAAVRAKLAESLGIPPGAIFKEETANTTREESIHIARTLRARNAAKVLLVTESLHMRRAEQVFEHAGLAVQSAVSADYPALLVSPGDRLWLAMRVAQESAALIYYHLAGYI